MKIYIFASVLSIFGLVACTSDPIADLSAEDSQVFITNYDKTAKFGDYRTFALADTVFIIRNDRVEVSSNASFMAVARQVQNTFLQRGYTQVQRTQKPDLGINVTIVSNTSTNIIPTNPFWGGGVGGWGGFNNFYPPLYTYYQTQDNYWYIEVIDLKNANTTTNNAKIVWSAQMRGGAIFEPSFFSQMLDNVFKQSEYFKR